MVIVIVLVYTFRAVVDSISVLMESAPVEINLLSLKKELKNIKGVIELHDLHVWSLNVEMISMSCHITSLNTAEVLQKATSICKEKFHIQHTTIQVEEPCKEHDLDCLNSLKLK